MFAGAMESTVVSPTSLEAWAGCPYRYFLSYVLRLSALETPEETAVIALWSAGVLSTASWSGSYRRPRNPVPHHAQARRGVRKAITG